MYKRLHKIISVSLTAMMLTTAAAGMVYADDEFTEPAMDTQIETEDVSVSAQSAEAPEGEVVHVSDIRVVYEDGTPAEDGIVFDLIDMVGGMSGGSVDKDKPENWLKTYTTKDGMLSGIEMKALRQYKIGFGSPGTSANPFWKTHELVGVPDSKKLMRIYSRYENEAPLVYDYDSGINGDEIKVPEIVIRKVAEDEEVVETRPTSCIMQLLLVEGKDALEAKYFAEGKQTFSLIRRDNNKKKTLYSNDGDLTIIGNADVPYTLHLEDNDMYSMKDIDFTIKLDSYGYYQAVRDGYDKDDTSGYLTYDYIYMTRIDGENNQAQRPITGSADSDGESFELIYRAEPVTLSGMKVMQVAKPYSETVAADKSTASELDKDIEFVFYNATTQSVQCTVTSEGGVLPDVELIRGQHYIVYAKDREYAMPNYYITLRTDGGTPSCDKCAAMLDTFYLYERDEALADTDSINRVKYTLPVYAVSEDGEDMSEVMKEVEFTFTSPVETVKAVSKDGELVTNLLEDSNYIVTVENDDEYSIVPFPMTMKDKSEYGSAKYAFNHLSCGSVGGFFLVPKGTEHDHDNTLVSPDGNTTLSGMNFGGGSYFVFDRTLDQHIDELADKDYEVVDIDTINMYRTELSQLAKGKFTITRKIPEGKDVEAVYYIDGDGKLVKVDSSEKEGVLTFAMDSIGLYNNVIVYKAAEGTDPEVNPGDNPGKPVPAKVTVKGTSITRLTAAKKAVNVRWKKQADKTTGYQIRYSRKHSMKGAKVVTVKSSKTTAKKIRKLSSKKRYYFQVRTYRKLSGKTYYSKWSAKKSVKVK